MLRSMTGFGEARRQIHGVDYAVELRSVNGRYFKASIRLPELWSRLEADLDALLRTRLHRGSIQFTLRMKSNTADSAYTVNTAALERYMEQLEVVRPEGLDIKLSLDLANLLQLPGTCSPPEQDALQEKSHDALMTMVNEAIERMLEMRAAEGKNLSADLLGQCGVVERHVVAIAQRAPLVIQDYHRRLAKRVEELVATAQIKLSEQDLAREVAVFAERADISEELNRLAGHLQQFRAAVDREDQPGRKLDFIAQEMLREANTIGSKANDTEIARAVVEIKTAIDRIKEQVQNVE